VILLILSVVYKKKKNCIGTNPCKSYSCDPSAVGNECVETDLCVPLLDLCKIVTCTPTGCVTTDVECDPPNGCYSASCEPTTGECIFQLLCDDSVPCTTDVCDTDLGKCVNTDIVCDDQDVCTEESCQDGSCASQRNECNDDIECTVDTCDAEKGCTFTPNDEVCKSADPCITSICDPKQGCVETPKTCVSEGKFCETPQCVSYEGCVIESRPCGENSTATCVFFSCDEDKDECTEEPLVCGAAIDTTLVLTSVLGTAAVAGIIIAVVLLVVGVGGGSALAYYQAGVGGGTATTSNNPLYQDDGTKSDNPLFKPA